MTRSLPTLLSLAAILAAAAPAPARQGDKPPVKPATVLPLGPAAHPAAPKQESKPLYDESADAHKQIADAVGRAKKDNKRVLIQWGANWCGWCHLLAKTLKSKPELSRQIMYEYELVHVDVGRFDKNLDIAKSYGADFKSTGIPYLTILDAEGKTVTNQDTGALEAKADGQPGYNIPKVLEFLKTNQAAPLNAENVLSEAMQRAQREHKRLFVHFGAPWCGWCHRLEDWLAKDDVSKTLATDFVVVKIDTDRMTGGADLLKRYTGGKATGIPYSVFLDPDGKTVAAAVNDKGDNLGCPWTDDEIAAFGKVLGHACRKIDTEQREALLDSLRGMRQATESRLEH